jgi:hypothetical protein
MQCYHEIHVLYIPIEVGARGTGEKREKQPVLYMLSKRLNAYFTPTAHHSLPKFSKRRITLVCPQLPFHSDDLQLLGRNVGGDRE